MKRGNADSKSHTLPKGWPSPDTLAKAIGMSELPKTFDPASIESRWYAHWEASGQFRPDRPNAEPWTIVNPPPNVTG